MLQPVQCPHAKKNVGVAVVSTNFECLVYHDGDVDLNKDVPDPQPTHSGGPAPIDVCSGVVLHVFASDPQDLPPNSHPSTNNSHGSIDASWLKSLSKKCASKGLAVNMWGVSSFDTDVIGLSSWYPLVRSTGGKVHRSVLGQIPKDERALLTEKMKRAIIPQIATKCLMKLRCSPQMNVGESSAEREQECTHTEGCI